MKILNGGLLWRATAHLRAHNQTLHQVANALTLAALLTRAVPAGGDTPHRHLTSLSYKEVSMAKLKVVALPPLRNGAGVHAHVYRGVNAWGGLGHRDEKPKLSQRRRAGQSALPQALHAFGSVPMRSHTCSLDARLTSSFSPRGRRLG